MIREIRPRCRFDERRDPGSKASRQNRRRNHGRRNRCGLGLVDSMLALGVLIVLGTMVGHIFEGWVERRISQAEGRVLSAWADAGATWLLRNRSEVATAVGLREITDDVPVPAVGADRRTPHRNRPIRLWIRDVGPDRTQLLAVASGLSDPVPIPVAGDGIHAVGMVRMRNDSPNVIGPALRFDLGPWVGPGRLRVSPGDLVAIRQVSHTTPDNDRYLQRRPVNGRLELNRMETDLNMGGHAITGVGSLDATTLRIDNLEVTEE